MNDFTNTEILILFEALDEHKNRLKHYPGEFTSEEAEATKSLWEAYLLEARYRGLFS